MGNLYYDKRQYDLAMEAWETSARLDDNFPTVWRNLALAYFNKKNEETKAIEYMERAFRLDTTDARILMELTSFINVFVVRIRNVWLSYGNILI